MRLMSITPKIQKFESPEPKSTAPKHPCLVMIFIKTKQFNLWILIGYFIKKKKIVINEKQINTFNYYC